MARQNGALPHAASILESDKVSLRTRLSYGLGTIGRDANYTLVSTYLMTYLTLAVGLSNWQLGAVGAVMIAARVWDAVNDPLMGTIIDNTRGRFGKFKPYILAGALLNSVFTVLLFSGALPQRPEGLFVLMFAIAYILWGMSYTMNDIAFWGMLPALTVNPREREKVTSLARIGASVGLFAVTALVPLLTAGRMNSMYRSIAVAVAVVFVACQVLVVWGVQVKPNAITGAKSGVRLRDMLHIIVKNDQLLAIGLTMLLFNIAYFTTTGFGMFFFYFDYGNFGGPEFTYFALTIGLTQILVLALYPQLSKRMSRRQLFTRALVLVVVGYLGFMATGYLLPKTMPVLIAVGFVLFAGQAAIQMLQYILLADTVEYGQWKLGTRNESVVFSLRPFIDKLAGAVQAGALSLALILSGLNASANAISELESNAALPQEEIIRRGNEIVQAIPPGSTLILRVFMLLVPLLLICAAYFVYRKLYKLDEAGYARIIDELEKRESGPVD